jgi:hypothetical protein
MVNRSRARRADRTAGPDQKGFTDAYVLAAGGDSRQRLIDRTRAAVAAQHNDKGFGCLPTEFPQPRFNPA